MGRMMVRMLHCMGFILALYVFWAIVVMTALRIYEAFGGGH